MNAYMFLLLFLLSTCQGEEQDDSPSPMILTTTKAPKVKSSLEFSCPEPTDIEPCTCSNQFFLVMDCSKVQDEEQLRKVFSAFFPSTDFLRFYMVNNTGVKVLEDGVFGNVRFQELYIKRSVLEIVMNDSLTPSLSTLSSIDIDFCQLTVFPFERLAEFTSLKGLGLLDNSIHSLPPLISSSLRGLLINSNTISHLSPDVFTLLAAIQQIDLSWNNLTEITPGTFRGLPELSLLSLSRNKIRHLQSLTFDDPVSFPRLLLLDRNNIDCVEVDAFKGAQGHSTIDMSNNALTTLEKEVWRPVLENGNSVILEGNSLLCDCDLAWLIRDPQLLKRIDNGRCADGTLLINLDPADFDICG